MKKSTLVSALFILLIINPSSPTFKDVSSTLPGATASNTMDIAVADMDLDGDPDLVLAMEWRPNLLLLNDGKGNFSISTQPNFLPNNFDSEDIAIADYDKDGDPDVVFAAEDDGHHEYYLNERGGKMKPGTFEFPSFISNSVATADLNGDGYADLLFGNQGPERIFINDKKAGFYEESNRISSGDDVTQDVKFSDVDNDGDLDILAGNEDGNKIYINDGKGFFKDETSLRFPSPLPGSETRKVTLADIDNDKDPDIFFSNVAFKPGRDLQDRLYVNNGKGVFTDVTATQFITEGEHSADAIFMDIDGDKHPDLVVGTFSPTGVKVYRNDGKGGFKEKMEGILPSLVAQNISVINADLNGDKLEDIYVGNFRGKDFLFVREKK